MIRMAGLSAEALTQAADEIAAAVPTGQTAVRAMPTDVSNLADVRKSQAQPSPG